MLALLQELGLLVSLVPSSGIQFLDFGLNADTARTTLHFFDRPSGGPDGDSQPELIQLRPDPEIPGSFVDAEGHTVSEGVYSVLSTRAIESALGRWLPLPYLRAKDQSQPNAPTFANGPTNWVRCRIVELQKPDEVGNTHRVTLAIDTALFSPREGRPYSAPAPEDAKTGAEFALAHQFAAGSDFRRADWVDDWLRDALVRQRRTGSAPAGRKPEAPLEHWARYLTILAVLGAKVSLPRLRFIDTISRPSRYQPINVDLMLDVGNSRTCGILVESSSGEGVDLNNAYPLELRDLTDPSCVHGEPFPSRIEFARPSFGNERLARRSGRSESFVWPSVARVGLEAQGLNSLLTGVEGTTGLSSPKRYLWDRAPRSHEWQFNRHADPEGGEPSVTSVAAVQCFREDGEYRKASDPPPLNALFSRSSLMTFFLTEVFIQAMVNINSPAKRYLRAHSEVPRRLHRIILTMPTGMALAEREIFRRRAQTACEIVWKEMGNPDDDPPQIVTQWDEATGTQAVFLYSEVKNNFNGDAAEFFRCSGRIREGYGVEPSLRIASVDIGGGTTDLIITTYQLEGSVAIVPVQEFREGFNFAGDDILCGIIERHILPNIIDGMRDSGIANPVAILAERIGDDHARMTEPEKTLRKLFANKVAMPMALRIVQLYENYDPTLGSQLQSLQLADIIPSGLPVDDVSAFLESAAHDAGGKDFRLADVVFRFDMAAIDNTVQRLIGQILGDLSEVIHLYSCDYLLLSGRPSRMPAVRSTFLAKLPVMADRLCAMHRYRVGSWYSFRDPAGRLADPKTTAAVGAMVCALSEGQLENFHLRSRDMKMVSTARYVGEMEATGQIRTRKEFFRKIDLEDRRRRLPSHTFNFYAPMFIGFRQLAAERWVATPLYRVDFVDPQQASSYALPLKVTIEQSPHDDDVDGDRPDFEITDVTDARGETFVHMPVVQRLQTLRSDAGYWTDTGVFDLPSGAFGGAA